MWDSQQYFKEGLLRDIDNKIIVNAKAIGELITSINPKLPPVFSLKHLAVLSNTNYGFLRSVVSRSLENPYRVFRIRKRPVYKGEERFRTICIPDPDLLKVQSWIAQNILSVILPHLASKAYAKGSCIMDGARVHCGNRWLIKLDICNFFESINEIYVYRFFRSLNYQPLVAFELTRLCTRVAPRSRSHLYPHWKVRGKNYQIASYNYYQMGHLPQGAPTSPMISNLVMRDFDKQVTRIMFNKGLFYTRYADDLILSTNDNSFNREKARQIISRTYRIIKRYGLFPNTIKTRISPPGSRKIVLGLLVNEETPRLTREFKLNLRRHLYFLNKENGPAIHAQKRGFSAIMGLKNHIQGLVAFACQVEPDYGNNCRKMFNKIIWPGDARI